MHKLARWTAAVLAVGAVFSAAAVRAADDAYPSKTIRLIVPFPPGGGTDIVARTVAAKLTERWKVPVVVDNKPGGNTIIAAEIASRAAPDGYTLFLPIDSTLSMNQSLYSKLPYDPIHGFAPITLAVTQPMVIAAHPSSGLDSVKAVAARAGAEPGKLSYAFGALPAQVAGEAFKMATKLDLTAIPYKGSGPAITDAVAGVVPLLFDALGPASSFIKSGKVKAIAVTSARRSTSLPDVPTLAESGLPGFDLVTWIGFVAPKGTPQRIVNKLNGELGSILQLPDVRERLATMGMDVAVSSPQEFQKIIETDAVKLGAVVKAAGIRLD